MNSQLLSHIPTTVGLPRWSFGTWYSLPCQVTVTISDPGLCSQGSVSVLKVWQGTVTGLMPSILALSGLGTGQLFLRGKLSGVSLQVKLQPSLGLKTKYYIKKRRKGCNTAHNF